MRLRLERLDRERNEALIKEMQSIPAETEAEKGEYNFGLIDRTEEEKEAERKEAFERIEQTGGTLFVTEEFVSRARQIRDQRLADDELDVVNMLLDPERPEGVTMTPKREAEIPLPPWILRTGVKKEE